MDTTQLLQLLCGSQPSFFSFIEEEIIREIQQGKTGDAILKDFTGLVTRTWARMKKNVKSLEGQKGREIVQVILIRAQLRPRIAEELERVDFDSLQYPD